MRRFYGLLLPCFYLILLLFCSCNGYSDLEVLLKLKSSMTGPQASGPEDWQDSESPLAHCHFAGVGCDEENRVVSLNVSFVPVFGVIPREIGLLDRLVNLKIAADNLTGRIPVEMGNLTFLRVLNISINAFNGNFPGEIFQGMTRLEVLDTGDNNFSGSLPIEVVDLKNIWYLSLGGNYLTGEIPERYSEIQSLVYLILATNGLTGKSPAFLARLKNLEEMKVGYNTYVGGVPPEFGTLSKLRVLDLASCNLTGEIPVSLANLKHLDSLFLQRNNLIGLLPPELSSLISLKSLDVAENELTGEIPESFSALQNIIVFNLFWNNFYGRIPMFIGDFPRLEVLQVWKNNFTFELPQNLGSSGKLKVLDVSSNHLSGFIPRDLCKGRKLERLILMKNSFVGPLPEGIGECKSLTRIRIRKYFLTGTIPGGIFNLPVVTYMELDNNLFSGELPSEMSCAKLGVLKISSNKITGKFPPAIGNLANLQTLFLDANRFSGEIPEEIFKIKSLSTLNISNNSISGEIPPSLSQCTSLTSIDFSRNNLTGEIPKRISKLVDLSILNLSRNQLSGEIPCEIRYMRSLKILDLSDNDFSGIIPADGQFSIFNESSFAGNANLCSSKNDICASLVTRARASGHHGKTALKLILITVFTLISALLLIIVAVYGMRKQQLQKPRPWKLTAFQRLDFKAGDVLECLKEENIIGKGGFGIVYRGSMPDGNDIAIKRLVCRGSERNDHGLSAEIKTLSQIKHRYIVKLLGYVSNKETNLLLYEYMPNGSLGELLHGSNGGQLEWETRYKIAVEAAKGLCYLHHDCSPVIIHRDVKPNNILLDSDYEAHVADFGLARFLQGTGASECISSIAEYGRSLRVGHKSDVYSFGVVLLELITGRKPVGDFGDGVDIVRWVRTTKRELPQRTDEAAVQAIVDPRMSRYALTSVIHMFKLAMMCIADKCCNRPTMREVVHVLTNPPVLPQAS